MASEDVLLHHQIPSLAMHGVRGWRAAAQTLAEGRAGLSSGTSRVRNLRRLVSAHRSSLARAPMSASGADPGTPEPRLGRAFQVQNDRVIEAGRQPGILARMLGSMLQTARKTAGLSYDQAAARLGCEPGWLIRVETGFAAVGPGRWPASSWRTGYGRPGPPARSSTWPGGRPPLRPGSSGTPPG